MFSNFFQVLKAEPRVNLFYWFIPYGIIAHKTKRLLFNELNLGKLSL